MARRFFFIPGNVLRRRSRDLKSSERRGYPHSIQPIPYLGFSRDVVAGEMDQLMSPVKRLEAELFLDGHLQLRGVHTHELQVSVESHELLKRVLGPILDMNVGRRKRIAMACAKGVMKRRTLGALAS